MFRKALAVILVALGALSGALNAQDKTSATLTIQVGHDVTLAWQPGNCSSGCDTNPVISYKVYRGTTNNGPYSSIGNPVDLTFTDTIVTVGVTYYYVVTAVDNQGVESVFSNQATAVIPTP